MAKSLRKIIDVVEAVNERLGQGAGYIVLLIMLTTTTEVVMRYVFNRPTMFAWPLNRIFFGVFILFAGLYNMKTGLHIRIEIFYEKFPPKVKFFAHLLELGAFLAFIGVLVWQTTWMGYNSLTSRELMVGAFRAPLYPFKVLIPIVCLLFLLEGIIVFVRKRN